MSIPLVRNNTKDAINTSIIAIKKNLERINSLLGLMDNSDPDLSGLATKQELEDAVTEINNTIDEVETSLQPVNAVTSGNMQSVTSNAVSKVIAFSSTEIDTGLKWIDGKSIFKNVISEEISSYDDTGNRRTFGKSVNFIDSLIIVNGFWTWLSGVPQVQIGRQVAVGSALPDNSLAFLWSNNIAKSGNTYDFSFFVNKVNYPVTKIKINLNILYTKN